MSEFNDVTCPTCGHTYGYHAWQEMQQQREEMETARHIRDFAKLTREVHKRQQAEMPEPTIDELLKWLFVVDKYLAGTGSDISSSREVEAIRAILEQHREVSVPLVTEMVAANRGVSVIRKVDVTDLHREIAAELRERKQGELEAIRAFVERVEKRNLKLSQGASNETLTFWHHAMMDELAAMEGEANAGTHD